MQYKYGYNHSVYSCKSAIWIGGSLSSIVSNFWIVFHQLFLTCIYVFSSVLWDMPVRFYLLRLLWAQFQYFLRLTKNLNLSFLNLILHVEFVLSQVKIDSKSCGFITIQMSEKLKTQHFLNQCYWHLNNFICV